MDVRLPGTLQKIMASEAEASRLAQARASEVMKIWLGKTIYIFFSNFSLILHKVTLTRHQKLYAIRLNFGCILDGSWKGCGLDLVPSWEQVGPSWDQKPSNNDAENEMRF